MDNEGVGAYCLPGYMKDRLIRSYEGERDFYEEKLKKVDSDTAPEDIDNYKNKVQDAETNLRTVEDMAVCDLHVDDTDVPAEPTADLDPLSDDD